MPSSRSEIACSSRRSWFVAAILVIATLMAACQAPASAGSSAGAPTSTPPPAPSAVPSPSPRPSIAAAGLGPVDIEAIQVCALLPETSIEAALRVEASPGRYTSAAVAPFCEYPLADRSSVLTEVRADTKTAAEWESVLTDLAGLGAVAVDDLGVAAWTWVMPKYGRVHGPPVRAVQASVVTDGIVLSVTTLGVPRSDDDLAAAALALVVEMGDMLESSGVPRIEPSPEPSPPPTAAPATGRCDARLRPWISKITYGLKEIAMGIESIATWDSDSAMWGLMGLGYGIMIKRDEFRASVPDGGSHWPGIERYGRWIERTADGWWAILEGPTEPTDEHIDAALGGFAEIDDLIADVSDEADRCP